MLNFSLRNLRSSYYDMPSQRDNLPSMLNYSAVITDVLANYLIIGFVLIVSVWLICCS